MIFTSISLIINFSENSLSIYEKKKTLNKVRIEGDKVEEINQDRIVAALVDHD